MLCREPSIGEGVPPRARKHAAQVDETRPCDRARRTIALGARPRYNVSMLARGRILALASCVGTMAACTSLLGNDFTFGDEGAGPGGGGSGAGVTTTASGGGGSGAGTAQGGGGSAPTLYDCNWTDVTEVDSLAGAVASGREWSDGQMTAVRSNRGLRLLLERQGEVDVYLMPESQTASQSVISQVNRVFEFKRVSGTNTAALAETASGDLTLYIWDDDADVGDWQLQTIGTTLSLDDFQATFALAAPPAGTFLPEIVYATTGRYANNNGPFEIRFTHWTGSTPTATVIHSNTDANLSSDDFELLGLFRPGDGDNVLMVGPPFEGASRGLIFHLGDNPSGVIEPVATIPFSSMGASWLAPFERLDRQLVFGLIEVGATAGVEVGVVGSKHIPSDAGDWPLNAADPIPVNEAGTNVRMDESGLIMVGPRLSAQGEFAFLFWDTNGNLRANQALPVADQIAPDYVAVKRAFAAPRDPSFFSAAGGDVDVAFTVTYEDGDGPFDRLYRGTVFCEAN